MCYLYKKSNAFESANNTEDVMNLRVGIDNKNETVTAYVANLFDGTYFTNAYPKTLPRSLPIGP